jgi:NADPH-dependent F420 reductase
MEKTISIAIVGGTGSLGTGVGRRLARPDVKVIIGSRDAERARKAAEELNRLIGAELVQGKPNEDAAREADMVLIAVPYEGHSPMISDLAPLLKGKLIIDAVVPLNKGKPFVPPAGSALQEAQQILGNDTPVVGALHNISAVDLQNPDAPLGDVLVCGDSNPAKEQVIELLKRIGARAFDAGPAGNAYVIEGLTGVLIALNRKYKSKHATIKITGIGE